MFLERLRWGEVRTTEVVEFVQLFLVIGWAIPNPPIRKRKGIVPRFVRQVSTDEVRIVQNLEGILKVWLMDACAEFPFTNSISQAMTPSSVLTRFVDFNETEDVDKAMKKQGEKGVTISYNQPKGDKGKDGKGKDGKGKGKDGKGKAGFI